MSKSDCETEYYYVGALINNRYRLTDFIGAGGMACVYRAVEDGTPHAYAVKFLRSQYHNQDYLIKFFEQEASNMRDLAHPNIVRFYRFVNAEKYSYIVMDYINGYALSDIIKRMTQQNRHIPLDEVVRIMVQIARALDTIHRDGFVHRDIKPSNVLIQKSDGKAFLGDLGITTTTRIELAGAGTAAYMAPELAESGIADQRTDIYAYGIMLFEMLARKRPFLVTPGLRGEEAEQDLIAKHKNDPVPDITGYRNGLPVELNAIMQQALAKNPAERYTNIMTLARDVHEVLKPHLSEDMQDFAQISHISGNPLTATMTTEVAAAAPTRFQPSLTLLAVIVIGSMLLLGLLGLTASGVFDNATPTRAVAVRVSDTATTRPSRTPTNLPSATQLTVGGVDDALQTRTARQSLTPSHTPTQTDTPTKTYTPTITFTPTPRPTSTPNPLERQPVYPFLSGVMALAVPDSDRLLIEPADPPLRYLRVGDLDGFRLDMDAIETSGITRYGVAFRLQDGENYLRLTIAPDRGDWRLDEVVDGLPTTLRAGSLSGDPFAPISVTGRQNFFQFELGGTRGEQVSSRWNSGSLGLWLESETGNALLLDSLVVSLVGPEAIRAVAASPTPAAGYGDPFRFLRADVEALAQTNDVVNSAINCPVYIDLYQDLDRHADNPNSTVRRLARNLIRAGEPIYTRCQARSPDEPLSFISGIDDYLDWEATINDVIIALRDQS